MAKAMHKIILFIEPIDEAFFTPEKAGHLFMNRFAVDEDASFEVLNVMELGQASEKMSYPQHPEYIMFQNERGEKGMGLFNVVCILESDIE